MRPSSSTRQRSRGQRLAARPVAIKKQNHGLTSEKQALEIPRVRSQCGHTALVHAVLASDNSIYPSTTKHTSS